MFLWDSLIVVGRLPDYLMISISIMVELHFTSIGELSTNDAGSSNVGNSGFGRRLWN